MIETAQREAIRADDVYGNGLSLNAAVLDFGDAIVEVDVHPRSKDPSELRWEHRATHVHRSERHEIFAAPIVEGAPRLSEKKKMVARRRVCCGSECIGRYRAAELRRGRRP